MTIITKSATLIALIGTTLVVVIGGSMALSRTAEKQAVLGGIKLTSLSSSESVASLQTDAGAGSETKIVGAQQVTGKLAVPDPIEPNTVVSRATLFEFVGGEPAWYTVDDNVMGGISRSTTTVDAASGLLIFAGTVSLANNGGFASARSQWVPYDLGSFDGIVLRLRGDGKSYRFRIRTEESGRDIAYTAIFATEAGAWAEVYIAFAAMVPMYRGFVVDGAGALEPEFIRSFGLMIADNQQGEFKLEVDWIKAQVER